MSVSNRLKQNPEPGIHIQAFRGDCLKFSLSLDEDLKGRAWIRTNIGHIAISRKEIIEHIDNDKPFLGHDWFDIPMEMIHDRFFQITLPMTEVGHCEAKCFFLEDGKSDPQWPEGPNTIINVRSSNTCCANSIYNAFVRQFGPNKAGKAIPGKDEKHFVNELDKAGYTVIPKSGTFRNLIEELDFIIGRLGCRFLHLLPIHPTPTTYARMGRFGSPYAALSFTAVDPALAEFDPKATPLEQFIELVDAVHARNAGVIIDIAANHTGWAASLHETHPEWLVRDKDGRIEVPGAWGIQWEDLTRLDYSKPELWKYMAEVFLTWCKRGVDGFRCDAGYMIPVPAWKYIVAVVRQQYPDTIFLLEGLGGKISVARDILNIANFDWAYSELFQNYDRSQIESYLPLFTGISLKDGLLVNFAETHDNNRLAARSHVYARMRTALCALFSIQGGFGFANGVEWLATEKINVHESNSLNWGSGVNQVDLIRRLTAILKIHPAFHDKTSVKLIQKGHGNHAVLLRFHEPSRKKLVVVVNLDDLHPVTAYWEPQHSGLLLWDLLTGESIQLSESEESHFLHLAPGQVFCLTEDYEDLKNLKIELEHKSLFAERLKNQHLKAKVLDIWQTYNGVKDIGQIDIEKAVKLLASDPVACCNMLNPSGSEAPRVVTWQWPHDARRHVMVPPGHFLLVKAKTAFRAKITDGNRTFFQEQSFSGPDNSHFALFTPLPSSICPCSIMLKLSLYLPERCHHIDSHLLYLAVPGKDPQIEQVFHRSQVAGKKSLFLSANKTGAVLRAPIDWGNLYSRYDALLAANLNQVIPENRWIMLTRFRAWGLFQGYSTEICMDCFDAFGIDDDGWGLWRFCVPMGQGEHVFIIIGMKIDPNENLMEMNFFRYPKDSEPSFLPDTKPIQLILRPDIENRSFHETTKAYLGPENIFHKSTAAASEGFVFQPDPYHKLEIRLSGGNYYTEPQWQYMIHRPVEADRGLDPHSDLFSPGYFSISLKGGQKAGLTAHITSSDKAFKTSIRSWPKNITGIFDNPSACSFTEILRTALKQYIVKRGALKSVIAGYPWFLDWGRDALIVVRGMIAAGFHQDAKDVLIQFGQFEHQGTLPNMINGYDAGNRDTSDAQLWFFTACSDLINAEGNAGFLNQPCGNRTILEVLISIGESYLSGTMNGIGIDSESGLVFSPSHYTWMDTNHPAGTPREGYPVEIQALWFSALTFLARYDNKAKTEKWEKLADKVRNSAMELFFLKEEGFLSDCLHAAPGTSARMAQKDDALRPNQLLAITLGLISDKGTSEKILKACEELLVPGAIRSLADRPLKRPLEIRHNGQPVNDPYHPYQGKYTGDEDSRRKPAYHNGTAWTWLFPSYCEAWIKCYGKDGKDAARAILYSSINLIQNGCINHVPEILDGDYPHTSRGCDAQAWGVSELLRVWLLTL